MRTPINPSSRIDLGPFLGVPSGVFELNVFDGPDSRRFSLAVGGCPNEGLELAHEALPALAAVVGGASLFLSDQIDFTEGGLSVIGPPPMPGFWGIPLSMKLIAKTVTTTDDAGPTITVGNGTAFGGSGHDNMAMEQGGWIVPSVPAEIEIVGISSAPLVDLSTQIKVNVLTPASGGSFLGRIAMVLQLIEAF